jgi:hypothetical protein
LEQNKENNNYLENGLHKINIEHKNNINIPNYKKQYDNNEIYGINKIKAIVTKRSVLNSCNLKSKILKNDSRNHKLVNEKKNGNVSIIDNVTIGLSNINLDEKKKDKKSEEDSIPISKECFSSRNITNYKNDILYKKNTSFLNDYLRGIYYKKKNQNIINNSSNIQPPNTNININVNINMNELKK